MILLFYIKKNTLTENFNKKESVHINSAISYSSSSDIHTSKHINKKQKQMYLSVEMACK